jgi:hypothetical protein
MLKFLNIYLYDLRLLTPLIVQMTFFGNLNVILLSLSPPQKLYHTSDVTKIGIINNSCHLRAHNFF